MYYRLKNPEIFFKDTRPGRKIYWFSCPDLRKTPPFSNIKRDSEWGILFQFLQLLTSCKGVANEVQWLSERDLKQGQSGGKGSPYSTQMAHLVSIGVLEVCENIEELVSQNLRNSEFSANNTIQNRTIQTDTESGCGDPNFGNSPTPYPERYIRFSQLYPKKVGANIGAALLAGIQPEKLESFFKAVSNYAEKVRLEQTEQRYIISPGNFIKDRWVEFVDYKPKKNWREKLKEEMNKIASDLESSK